MKITSFFFSSYIVNFVKKDITVLFLFFLLTNTNAADNPEITQLTPAAKLQTAINTIPLTLIQNSLNFTAALIGPSEVHTLSVPNISKESPIEKTGSVIIIAF